ncbi:MAG: DUF2959 family protein [Candidatus Paceibacterota bacterium]
MKNFIKPGNAIIVLLLATSFTLAACSTTGMQRSENVQSSMKSVDNDIKLIVVQIEAIGSSLNELTKPGQADVKRAYDVFSNNVSKIKKMENDFSKHADEMTESGKIYFQEWDKNNNQYDNPEIQKSSNERRAELGEIYDRIAENNKGVKEAFRIYVSDVNQINAYMSNDLTTRGITSIASLSDQTVRNGNMLKNELENLQSAIEDARAEMTQTGISMN